MTVVVMRVPMSREVRSCEERTFVASSNAGTMVSAAVRTEQRRCARRIREQEWCEGRWGSSYRTNQHSLRFRYLPTKRPKKMNSRGREEVEEKRKRGGGKRSRGQGGWGGGGGM